MKIFSQINKKKLLFSIYKKKQEGSDTRYNISPEDAFLQGSFLKFNKGQSIKPHYHLKNVRVADITQEAWLVSSGCIKVKFYDIDNSFLNDAIIKEGECVIMFGGGHSFEVLEEGTSIFEFKNGPYLGSEIDKKNF
jgi:hypothetical protein